MSDKSHIEWTEATWNPVRGCTKVSAGCDNCYAMGVAHRFSGPGQPYEGLTRTIGGRGQWNGRVSLHPEKLDQPLRWRKPRRIFVNSMSDLFHEDVPFEFIDKVFAAMTACDRHTFQILTKRPQRMLEWFQRLTPDPDFGMVAGPVEVTEKRVGHFHDQPMRGNRGGYDNCGLNWPARNIWLGVSVEDQATADERIPPLLETPAAVRWISAEPLLGPVNLRLPTRTFEHSHGIGCAHCCNGDRCDDPSHLDRRSCPYCRGTGKGRPLDWIVAGGESGPRARPMHPDWARLLRGQCQAAGVPFFFKQWGEWLPSTHAPKHVHVSEEPGVLSRDGTWRRPQAIADPPEHVFMLRVGKKRAGRQLDGRTWDEVPT